ncbi:MAG: hypothetical protein IPL82_10720 [Elusimicrobia bacterium]|nr:hypothetical protein [Elusimicrobiota bacterium]
MNRLKKLRPRLLAVPMAERRAALAGLVNDRWVSRFKKRAPRAAAGVSTAGGGIVGSERACKA